MNLYSKHYYKPFKDKSVINDENIFTVILRYLLKHDLIGKKMKAIDFDKNNPLWRQIAYSGRMPTKH